VGGKGDIPRPVVLDVVFLDLLDVVVGLRVIHSFRTVTVVNMSVQETLPEVGDLLFPCKVPS
jgi:hypothetical protein